MSRASYAVDTRTGWIGEVMGREGGRVQLRPVGGGREWDCRPEDLAEAPAADVLRERVRSLNRAGRITGRVPDMNTGPASRHTRTGDPVES